MANATVGVLTSGIVKLRLTAVSDPQHGGFTAGSSPVSWGSIDELFVNLTVPFRTLYELSRLAYGDRVDEPAQLALWRSTRE